jgi:hypothetical protein
VPEIRKIFWRAVTPADFFNVERSREAAPSGGGGQSYFSLSFKGLTHDELGAFLEVAPPSLIRTTRPTVTLEEVAVIDAPLLASPLTFRARYLPPRTDDRYRIARQNRQFQDRHPAWTPTRGFPRAPDDVLSAHDPRMPDLTYLKIYVAQLDDGSYRAGFVNSGVAPPATPPGATILFAPYDRDQSAGVIDFGPGDMPVDSWLSGPGGSPGTGEPDAPPEVVEAEDATRIAAGKRPRGQGRRLSAAERQAIELQAMALAIQHFESQGWDVEDVSAYRPFDLRCTRNGEELRIEVKGTTGDGSSVLLTPGEVTHTREFAGHVSLVVVSGILIEGEGADLTANGGELHEIMPWEIIDADLRATGFEYRTGL